MPRSPKRDAAAVIVIAAALCTPACRYVLGLSDRTEATEPLDAGLDAIVLPDADVDADGEAPCVGKTCVPRSCRPADGGVDVDGGGGTGFECGPDRRGDCCEVVDIPAGTFVPTASAPNASGPPAHVNAFRLDKYEVSVARFRAFVQSGGADTPPSENAGKLDVVPFSGWDTKWNQLLLSGAEIDNTLSQHTQDQDPCTWGDKDGRVPITHVTWYEAFAFCVWDGGRLPTESEWAYASAGGDQHRVFPWSNPAASETVGPSYALYCPNGVIADGGAPEAALGARNFTCIDNVQIGPIGAHSPAGDGLWGNADLGGNVFEWTLDWFEEAANLSCDNGTCANTNRPGPNTTRAIRGGAYRYPQSTMRSIKRDEFKPQSRHGMLGFRCARF